MLRNMKTNKQIFFEKYPQFDEKYYISAYPDIGQIAHKDSYNGVRKHYNTIGHLENRRTHAVVFTNKTDARVPFMRAIPESSIVYISSALTNLTRQFSIKYPFQIWNPADEYNHKPMVFFGVYTDDDVHAICNNAEMNNISYIVWGGEDANPINKQSVLTIQEIRNMPNIIHISISKCIYNSLLSQGITSILTNFNLVDPFIFFKSTTQNNISKNIYIYNGLSMGRGQVYGEDIYLHIIRMFQHKITFILSSELNNIPYTEMPNIYNQCFLAMRLTSHDGNANTVQECAAMGLPIIHNGSDSGIPWKTIDDVAKHIQSLFFSCFGEVIESELDLSIKSIPPDTEVLLEKIECDGE